MQRNAVQQKPPIRIPYPAFPLTTHAIAASHQSQPMPSNKRTARSSHTASSSRLKLATRTTARTAHGTGAPNPNKTPHANAPPTPKPLHALTFLRSARLRHRDGACACTGTSSSTSTGTGFSAPFVVDDAPHGAKDAIESAHVDDGGELLLVLVLVRGAIDSRALGSGLGARFVVRGAQGSDLASAQDRLDGQFQEELGGRGEECGGAVAGWCCQGVDAQVLAQEQWGAGCD